MAVNFNGTTSKIQNNTASGLDAATVSFLVWLKPNTSGEEEFGRVLLLDEAGNSIFFLMLNSGPNPNTFQFTQVWSTANGSWVFPDNIFGFNRWHCIGVTYDRGSTTNNPVLYHFDSSTDDRLASVTIDETSTPEGTVTTPNTGYCVGNQSDQTRTFDGEIAYLQYWDAILTENELNSAMWYPGRIRGSNLKLYKPMLFGGEDLSGNGNNGAETDIAVADGPPVAAPFAFDMGWQGPFTVVVGDQIVTPTPVAVPILVPIPSLVVANVLTPDVVAVPLVVPSPTVAADVLFTPTSVTVPLVIPAPNIVFDETVSPEAVAVVLAIPVPFVDVGITIPDVFPLPVAVVLSIPVPVIVCTMPEPALSALGAPTLHSPAEPRLKC